MKRTITALYETSAQAERARDALNAAGLGGNVEIHDQEADGAKAQHGLGGWLSDMFGGHHDSHLYAEGLRRGHVLLTAKVDDLNETRAAEILDAEPPVDLTAAETTWRKEGWTPTVAEPHPTHRNPPQIGQTGVGQSTGPYAPLAGSGIRAYTL